MHHEIKASVPPLLSHRGHIHIHAVGGSDRGLEQNGAIYSGWRSGKGFMLSLHALTLVLPQGCTTLSFWSLLPPRCGCERDQVGALTAWTGTMNIDYRLGERKSSSLLKKGRNKSILRGPRKPFSALGMKSSLIENVDAIMKVLA